MRVAAVGRSTVKGAVRSDWDLLEQWRQDNKAAGAELVERYYKLVHRFFANKVAQRHDALDCVQETFLACSRNKANIRPETPFRSYLFGIAMNQLRRYIERRVKHPNNNFAELRTCDLMAPSLTSIVTRRREELLLVAALRELPLEQQIVIELNIFDDRSGHEIAELLGVPEGTVRSRLRLARDRIRTRIAALAESAAERDSTLDGLESWAARIRQLIDRPEDGES